MSRAAWEWEADRSAFKTGRPWLKLTRTEQSKVAAYFRTTYPLREHDPDYLSAGFFQLHADAHAATTAQLHVLEIDWFASPTAIKDALAEWVDAHPTHKRELAKTLAKNPATARLLPKNQKGGRPPSYPGLLLSLAMHRLEKFGVPRAEAVKLLTSLATQSGVQQSRDNKLSPQHWSGTIASVDRELAKRKRRNFQFSYPLGLR